MKRLMIPLLLLFLLLGGCGKTVEKTNTESEEPEEDVLMEVADRPVDYRELLVYLDATRRDYELYYGPDIWDYYVSGEGDTIGSVVKDEVLSLVIRMKIVCSKANELNIFLSEEELKEVDRLTADYMKELEGSPLLLEGVNENVVRRLYNDNLLAKKIFDTTTLNINTNVPDELAHQHHFYTIALKDAKIGVDGQREEYTGEEKEKIKNTLYEILEGWKKSEDKRAYAVSKTEEDRYTDLYIGPEDNEYAGPVELLKGMKDGEYSDITESDGFYRIYYCVAAFDIDATQEKKEEIIEERRKEAFEDMYAKWKEETTVKISRKVWESIDVFGK